MTLSQKTQNRVLGRSAGVPCKVASGLRSQYFIVLSNSSTIFNITLELNFHIGKSDAIAKYFIQLVHCTIYSNVQSE